jgi:hypothetical protein
MISKLKQKKGKEKKIILPRIEKKFLPKSQSPSPITIRSKTPVFSPKSVDLDTYFQEFDRIFSKNTVVRKNWVLAKEKLIDLQVSKKICQATPNRIDDLKVYD